jgi:hypothetical protein
MSDCCASSNNGLAHNIEQTTDCCATPKGQLQQEHKVQVQNCPLCGTKGKKVGMETVKAMLAVTLHEIRPDRNYLFCRTEGCAVVYFADDGAQTFTEADLREKVYQKHPNDDDVFVCYCFRHTRGSIRARLLESGQSTVVETVTVGTQIHQCACELRNPQGSCCLGNVGGAVKRMKQELNNLNILLG